MLNRARASDMSGDRDVIRRIGEHHLCELTGKQAVVSRRFERARANEAMSAEEPQIATLRIVATLLGE